MLSESWGAVIRMRRDGMRIKQRELADKAGISRSYLSHIENGVTDPRGRVKKAILDALNDLEPTQITIDAVAMDQMRAEYQRVGAFNRSVMDKKREQELKQNNVQEAMPMSRLQEFEKLMKEIVLENERIATMNSLVAKAHKNAITKGWHEELRSFGDYIALMHSELSEALEDYRNGHGVQEIYYEGEKPCGIPVELADVMIRIFDMCGLYNIDLEYAVLAKMEYNKTRPHKHGGKVI